MPQVKSYDIVGKIVYLSVPVNFPQVFQIMARYILGFQHFYCLLCYWNFGDIKTV